MKKMIAVVSASFLLLVSVETLAKGCERGHDNTRLERLSKVLQLSGGQADKVKLVMAEQRQSMILLKDQTRSKLGTILTEEQLQRFDAMKKPRHKHRDAV